MRISAPPRRSRDCRTTVQPTPQARNSERYDNRPACCGSASCIPICPVQAKYDATSHVAKAEQAGAQLVSDAVVSQIEVGADGRISALIVKRPDGSEDRAVGKVFVIAAHGIETPKLLLQSRTDRWPAGVANSSDQVGRNLMDHPSQSELGVGRRAAWRVSRTAVDRGHRVDARRRLASRSRQLPDSAR